MLKKELSPNAIVKRLNSDCCGMTVEHMYPANVDFSKSYVQVLLPDNSWTSPHFIPDFFEIVFVKEETNA